MKIQKSILGKVIYKFSDDNKNEIFITEWNLGGRIYIVKWLIQNRVILKVKNNKVLCGARGLGMVWSFPTKYYLAEILENKLPDGWNHWHGYMNIIYEGEFGRNWKKGIKELEQINNSAAR